MQLFSSFPGLSPTSTAMLGTAVQLSVLLGLLGLGNAQMFHMGPCPDPPVQQDFDINKV